MSASDWAVVVPTVGRPSLAALLSGLADAVADGPSPREVVVVDDRPGDPGTLDLPDLAGGLSLRVVRSGGRGPAAARNLGWRQLRTEWVVFLDDDVLVPKGWPRALAADLRAVDATTGGVQGRVSVPTASRRPTDWERSTAGLQHARWATADMAYRRTALLEVEGFDERFPRAFREDADLALRVRDAGWELVVGDRTVLHPVRPAGRAVSVDVQRGNADDALMRRLHGRRWRQRAETGSGRLGWHVATVVAEGLALACAPASRRSRAARAVALGSAAVAGLAVADFARCRIAPGPRTADEVLTMLWTSVAIPPAAVVHRLRGAWRHRSAQPWSAPVRALLLDRDGTLVHDVPYNGDPDAVDPVPGASEALDRARAAGLRLGVVTNQSGIGRALLTPGQVAAVNRRIEGLLGPFTTWQVCPHAPDDGCGCRKPAAGLVRAAAADLGVRPEECVVIGDIGADVEAARAAGARSVLVPTAATLAAEVERPPVVASDLRSAVDLVLGWRRG